MAEVSDLQHLSNHADVFHVGEPELDEEEFHLQPDNYADFDSFSVGDDNPRQNSLEFRLDSSMGSKDDEPNCFFYGEEEEDEHVNFVTDLFESGGIHLAEDQIWESNSVDSDSHSEELEVNSRFLDNDNVGEDNDEFVVSSSFRISRDMREAFEWEEVSERVYFDERDTLSYLIGRSEEVSSSSSEFDRQNSLLVDDCGKEKRSRVSQLIDDCGEEERSTEAPFAIDSGEEETRPESELVDDYEDEERRPTSLWVDYCGIVENRHGAQLFDDSEEEDSTTGSQLVDDCGEDVGCVEAQLVDDWMEEERNPELQYVDDWGEGESRSETRLNDDWGEEEMITGLRIVDDWGEEERNPAGAQLDDDWGADEESPETHLAGEWGEVETTLEAQLVDHWGEEERGQGRQWVVLLEASNMDWNLESMYSEEIHDDGSEVPNINLHQDYIWATEYDNLLSQLVENINPSSGSTPASKSVVENLALVVMTREMLEGNNEVICAVCRDGLVVGEKATRLPCCHLFHGDCILPWLDIRNTCPVCRHELPTDDEDDEQRRNDRREVHRVAW